MTGSIRAPRGITLLAGVAAAMILLCAQIVFAGTPLVTSLTTDPPSLSNNYIEVISWTASDSTGSILYFSCPPGVTLKLTTGSSLPCNTLQSYSANGSDSVSFIVTNVSGTAKNIGVKVYPKDSAGVNYDAGARSTSFYVDTSAQPIIEFSVSSTTVPSGGSLTLTWKGVDTTGTNIAFDCTSGIRIVATSQSNLQLPCGVPAFSTDLPQSGSITVTPTNSSISPATISARIFPVITTGTYDGTHSLSAVFTISGKPPRMNPSVIDFTSSQSTVAPGVPFTIFWSTANASGANIQIPCSDSGFVVESITGTTSVPLSCNRPAFVSALPSMGSTTLAISNRGTFGNTGNVAISLLPQDSSGTYFGITARTMSIRVLPSASASAFPSPSANLSVPPFQGTAAGPITVPATVAASQAVNKSTKHYTFARPLSRGSKSADVTALQEYLAQDKSIYPEGLVTGYFGPVTEKAVQRFQEKYNIATKGAPGYGTVGPNTRAKLNAIQ